MSIRTVSASPTTSNAGLDIKTLDGNYSPVAPWVRNPSWAALPTVLSTDQKVVGLYAIYENANFIALTCTSNYTVDWGDGTTINYFSGVQANYEYDYNNVALNGTDAPVTFTDTGDLVTRTAHGYTDGMTVVFYSIVTTTGITVGVPYYVINATANTFQISDSLGGSAVALTNDGTGTLLPYKLAIVTITPQAANNLVTVDLNLKHSQVGLVNGYSTGWLDLTIAMPSGTTLTIGAPLTAFVTHGLLEQVVIKRFNGTTLANCFRSNCTALRSVDISGISNVTNFLLTFGTCSALTDVLITDTNAATDLTQMFSSCSSLVTVPLFNTAAVTNMTNMFNACRFLTSVPLFDTSAVTTFTGMLQNCPALIAVPLFNIKTTGTVSMNSMFVSCVSLKSVPLFNTVAVTTMANMFQTCSSLTSVPLFNTVAVTNMTNMFNACTALTSVPLFNTAAVTDMASMFSGCATLTTVPLFNTAVVNNMASMFNACRLITTVPLFNTVSVVGMSNMFTGCFALTSVPLFNTTAVTNMSAMFSSCTSLTSVPLFNTALVTNMNSMFQSCTSLLFVPLFNTAAVTNMTSMFQACTSLAEIPALTTTAVTSSANFSTIFTTCPSLTRIEAKNFRFTFSVASCKLSKTALEEIFSNLPSTATAQTLTITSNYGNPTAISLTGTRTAGNAVILMASTANLAVGMLLTGTGINTAVAVTIQGNPTNTVTRVAHGIPDGTIVSFATIVTTTGISTYTPYYVVSATVDTFQLSLTLGGAAITLTNNGSGTLLYGTFITAIVPNVSITVTVPPSASGATTLTFRELNASIATLKNWALTF
jgi:surface protein